MARRPQRTRVLPLSNLPLPLPRALLRLIEAAKHSESEGVSPALREFGTAALWTLPARGVFVVDDNATGLLIRRVAEDYFGLVQAHRRLQEALAVVEEFSGRDAIESAHNQVQGVMEDAHFYAGLAFGITLTDFS
jgi:hypothetical protein